METSGFLVASVEGWLSDALRNSLSLSLMWIG
jgi:hypothetical protein